MERVFIIAEAGVNHNGDFRLARQLVDKAYEAGADAVKFQTFSAEAVCHADAPKAAYQKANASDKAETQLQMLKSLELSVDEFAQLKEYAGTLGLEFMSTAFDEKSLDALVGLGMERIKLPSGELTNLPFLAHAARKNLPLILSTGMASMAEVEEAVETIQENHSGGEDLPAYLTILHCTSNYPTENDNVNLLAIDTLRQRFRCPVGYSDHTKGIVASPCAVALGATVIEKHFTLDRGMDGPDHKASLEPHELRLMVTNIRETSAMLLGGGAKEPRASEAAVAAVARRSLVLVKDKAKGDAVLAPDVRILRPATGIPPKFAAKVVGQKLSVDLKAGTPLCWAHLQCGEISSHK